MQMYGGSNDNLTFNVSGIPSHSQRDMRMQLVIEAYQSLLYDMAYVAQTFNLADLQREIMQCH